ncbi:hypothetical protein [Planococcus halocryophilus]|uniref:hypothetical protein n=1 Tax=Planococcus halocryophilus TaxID=1215089 RepID=UPI001F0D50E1|nr:hypothetical protein [Planococcus halocryophilus]MCH4826807.1 hypothetical protein [Planococcus halocryophilus]
MYDKKFSFTVMAIFATLTITAATFNFWIDPLWHYGHAHELNDVQVVTDEREQKTAQQFYQQVDADTLLLGSSRSTYIQPSGFQNWQVYNYSVSNLSMREYYTMMIYAFDHNPDYQRVLLGVDFFKSSEEQAENARAITGYETKVKKPFYRIKNLLSLDALGYAIDNVKLSASNNISEDRLYNRQGDAFARKLSEEETAQDTATKITRFEDTFYGDHYVYYSRYKEIMQKVHDSYPQAEKIVYTTPISTELFKSLVETGLLDDYEIWLRDLVSVYGGVWNFMYPNRVTNDINNYYDGHHFYPEIGALISKRLEKGEDADVPEDFGVLVTEDNIDEHLAMVRQLVAEFE